MTTLKRKTLCHMVFEGDCVISTVNTYYCNVDTVLMSTVQLFCLRALTYSQVHMIIQKPQAHFVTSSKKMGITLSAPACRAVTAASIKLEPMPSFASTGKTSRMEPGETVVAPIEDSGTSESDGADPEEKDD